MKISEYQLVGAGPNHLSIGIVDTRHTSYTQSSGVARGGPRGPMPPLKSGRKKITVLIQTCSLHEKALHQETPFSFAYDYAIRYFSSLSRWHD